MQRTHVLVLALSFAVLGWFGVNAFAQGESAPTATAEVLRGTTVYLVRHAEKGKDDPRDPSLTEEGQARAEELARVLGSAGVTHLFSTPYKRTRQTLAPLAKGLDLPVEPYDPRAVPDLLKKLGELPAGSVVVVSGHSNTTPGLYRALGGKQAADLEESPYGRVIPEDVYDRLYSVTLANVAKEVRCLAALERRYGER